MKLKLEQLSTGLPGSDIIRRDDVTDGLPISVSRFFTVVEQKILKKFMEHEPFNTTFIGHYIVVTLPK